jgi:hypothetical protein
MGVRNRHTPGRALATHFANCSHFGNLFVFAKGEGLSNAEVKTTSDTEETPTDQGEESRSFVVFRGETRGSLASET